jgi:hypothetical protein
MKNGLTVRLRRRLLPRFSTASVGSKLGEAMAEIGDVFVPGGVPNVTYVPRVALKLEPLVADWLGERGRILSLSGPTKSGKTVLVRKAIPEAVEISGGDIDSMATFWSEIIDRFDAFPHIERQHASGREQGQDFTGGVQAGVPGLGGKFETTAKTSGEQTRGETLARDRPLHLVAKQKLRTWIDTVVFIDDFHYIPSDVQLAIVRGVKQLVFDGLRIVLASVPHRAFDVVRVEKEMTGRLEQLEIPLWRVEDLESIATRGFGALNARIHPNDLARLAREAYESPHLMQDFCLQYGKINDLRTRSVEQHSLQPPEDWDAFFRGRAPSASKTVFDLLAKGPPRTDRVPRYLKGGAETDIYGAVLEAIAATGPVTTITYDQLRTGLREVLEGEPPQLHEITRVLVQMSKIARDQIVGEPVVDFDEAYRTLYISDPFFAFFLRWGTSGTPKPLNGSRGPSLA